MNNLTKEEIKELIIIGFNLHKENERNIMTKSFVEKIINEKVDNYINEKINEKIKNKK